MALVTGIYVTSTGQPLPSGAIPQVEVVPSKNAVTVGGQVISVEPQTVTPDASTGAFSVDLIPTVNVLDRGFHYLLRGYYLNPDGYGSSGYTRVDVFEQKVPVPAQGGALGNLLGRSVGNDLVYAAPDAIDPAEVTGFQFNTETGDLYQWQE